MQKYRNPTDLQYKEDLASDEEIFAEKAKEINGLSDHVRELEEEKFRLSQQLSDAVARLKRQEDQLFQQQLQLNHHLLGKQTRGKWGGGGGGGGWGDCFIETCGLSCKS